MGFGSIATLCTLVFALESSAPAIIEPQSEQNNLVQNIAQEFSSPKGDYVLNIDPGWYGFKYAPELSIITRGTFTLELKTDNFITDELPGMGVFVNWYENSGRTLQQEIDKVASEPFKAYTEPVTIDQTIGPTNILIDNTQGLYISNIGHAKNILGIINILEQHTVVFDKGYRRYTIDMFCIIPDVNNENVKTYEPLIEKGRKFYFDFLAAFHSTKQR